MFATVGKDFYGVELIVKNGVGEDSLFIADLVHIQKANGLPFEEDFENSTINVDWVFTNNGVQQDWLIDAEFSAYDVGSNSLVFTANHNGDKASYSHSGHNKYGWIQNQQYTN